uniref:TPM domain-containing protein n=1 Tax=Arion vulgaris TaxID=1028688 RepID=A0A0B7A119_9EUPU
MDMLLAITCGVLILLTCAAPQVSSQGQRDLPQRWSVFDYPNPQYDYHLCGRDNASSVCDPNGVISRESADAIDGLINEVYREPNCLCYHCIANKHGYIIKVAIMPQMERVYRNGDNTSAAMLRDAQMYSYILTQRWRMEGACNETLLILFSRNDGILFTLTRQHTKTKLSDSDVQIISLAVRHYFDRVETFASGILEMIRRYGLVFEGKRSEAFRSAPVG